MHSNLTKTCYLFWLNALNTNSYCINYLMRALIFPIKKYKEKTWNTKIDIDGTVSIKFEIYSNLMLIKATILLITLCFIQIRNKLLINPQLPIHEKKISMGAILYLIFTIWVIIKKYKPLTSEHNTII